MKKYFSILLLLAIQVLSLNLILAQNIGINSTGTAPDSSAALDITSTTTGLLAPRMTTTQMNAITRPAKGLMVYNTTLNCFQVNTGTSTAPSWVKVSTATGRDNYVIVKTATDFPAPVSGTITLASGTLYEVNGTITLTSKIDLNGCILKGSDPVNDKLVYTSTSGELFTGSNTGIIQTLTLAATGVGGKLFNLNAGGASKNFTMQNCNITSCDNVGTIRGYAGNVYLNFITYSNNTNGITFQDDNNVVISTALWDNTNHNTFEKFIGTFNNIQIQNGTRTTTSGYSAVGIDVSGITSLSSGSLRSTMFNGSGTKTNGTFSSDWEVEAYGISTLADDAASGSAYITTSTSTTIATVNSPVKISGTTTSSNLFRFTMPANNKLTYTGSTSRKFTVVASVTALSASDGKNFSIYIAKNGSILTESKQTFKQTKHADGQSVIISCITSMSTNDYVEVWVENNSDATDFTADKLNLSIR